MKAAQVNEYGGEDVLKINDQAAKPPLADDQILVQVHAAGVNPFDYKVREGMVRHMAELKFPATLGGDFSGVVAEVGSAVTDFQVGQSVYGLAGALSGHGSFAEFVPVAAAAAASKPDKADYVVSAALPLAGVSAYQALVDHMNLQKGQKILIHGGSGGIGCLAIQMAKHFGAYVATTVGTKDVDYAKSLGADEVIDYKSQDFSTIIKDYDAVFDTVGGETNEKSYQVLVPGGILVSMAARVDQKKAKKYKIEYVSESTRVTHERLAQITKLVDEGVLHVNIDKVFSLDEAAQALEYVKTGHPRGKVVIQITD